MPVALALVAGVLAMEAGPAQAATPAENAFVQCSDLGGAIYVNAGGALLHVKSWKDYGYDGTANGVAEPAHSTATITSSSSCATRATKTPANGTFVRAVVADSAQADGWKWSGDIYEIVGGAPITVHAWANIGVTTAPTPVAVSAGVLSALAAPGSCPDDLAGCLYARPTTNTVFAGYSTTAKAPKAFYRIDSVGHPVPQAAATAGEKNVDQTSINACERMICAPNGNIVNAYGAGYGVLHVDGWAQDYPSAAAVSVQLSAGTSVFVVPANRPTSYVPAGTAGNHGFDVNLSVPAGTYDLCGTVLGTSPGATTQALGCSPVVVPGAKPGKVHRPKVKAEGRGRMLVKWKRPNTHGSPISAYIIKFSTGKKKQVSGSLHSYVVKHLPRDHRVTFKVRAINAVGLGSYSKSSKSATVR
ncbi:fibronectin type III domain-containing protein [Nocardioides sp. Iso805N]|uniref:fibronectin type III domain-containing protein n=1 Tax=Nocardioides sp. Iso805N TaxID=1283287 RepID=UPI0003764F89|nr:fibronectin type III domain-containing protein [Nocardioides sp. Iso805N]